MKAAGEPVRAEAVAAAEGFSTRIADSIRLVSQGGRAKVKVSVRAGSPTAPHAAAFENGGKPGKFRHPLFGNRKVWVEQDAHPYLLPALRNNLDKVAGAIGAAVDKYLSRHRL